MSKVTDAEIERVLGGHWNRIEDDICDSCRVAWPCTYKRLVDELMSLRALDESLHSGCTLSEGHPSAVLIRRLRAEVDRLGSAYAGACRAAGWIQ